MTFSLLDEERGAEVGVPGGCSHLTRSHYASRALRRVAVSDTPEEPVD